MWHLVRMSVMSRFTKSDVSFPFVFEMAVSGPFLPFQGFLHRETRTRYLVQLFPNSNHILQTDGWHNVIFFLSLCVWERGKKNRHCAKKHEFLTSSLQNSAPKVSVTVTAWDLVGLSIRNRATKMSQGAMPGKTNRKSPILVWSSHKRAILTNSRAPSKTNLPTMIKILVLPWERIFSFFQ